MTYVKLPDPGKGKNQIFAPWGESRLSKATPSGINALSKSPPTPAPPPSPGITLIGASFGYIHYCTEISEIKINLLPNTCRFHRKFRRYVSENAKNVHFREAKRTHAFGARYYFCRTNFELFPPGLLFPIGNTPYNITYLTYTKGCFFSQ